QSGVCDRDGSRKKIQHRDPAENALSDHDAERDDGKPAQPAPRLANPHPDDHDDREAADRRGDEPMDVLVENVRDPHRGREREHAPPVARRPIRNRQARVVARDETAREDQENRAGRQALCEAAERNTIRHESSELGDRCGPIPEPSRLGARMWRCNERSRWSRLISVRFLRPPFEETLIPLHTLCVVTRSVRSQQHRKGEIRTAEAGWILAGLAGMPKRQLDADAILERGTPVIHQQAHEIQPYGHLVKMPIALAANVCKESVENLNQLLADTITLRDLYKKHHWQVSGPTFYQLHLLFDKHFGEQNELVDRIAERIMLLGGVSVAMSADVAEMTLVPRPPRGREEVPVQISRLLHAHEIVLEEARAMARQAAREGDDGTNDLLVSDVIRTNELQVWFVAEHLVDGPLVHADGQ